MAVSVDQHECAIDFQWHISAHVNHHPIGVADLAYAALVRLSAARDGFAPHRKLAAMLHDIHGKEGPLRSLKLQSGIADGALLPVEETALVDAFIETEIPDAKPALKVAGIDFVEIVFCPRHNTQFKR